MCDFDSPRRTLSWSLLVCSESSRAGEVEHKVHPDRWTAHPVFFARHQLQNHRHRGQFLSSLSLSLFVSHAMQDVPDEDLLSHIPEAIRFIDEGRKQVGEDCRFFFFFLYWSFSHSQQGNVLVHCKSGVSRSASICIAYPADLPFRIINKSGMCVRA